MFSIHLDVSTCAARFSFFPPEKQILPNGEKQLIPQKHS